MENKYSIVCPFCNYEFDSCREDYIKDGETGVKYCNQCDNDFFFTTNYTAPLFSSYKTKAEASNPFRKRYPYSTLY